jgi:hypothetical protein
MTIRFNSSARICFALESGKSFTRTSGSRHSLYVFVRGVDFDSKIIEIILRGVFCSKHHFLPSNRVISSLEGKIRHHIVQILKAPSGLSLTAVNFVQKQKDYGLIFTSFVFCEKFNFAKNFFEI